MSRARWVGRGNARHCRCVSRCTKKSPSPSRSFGPIHLSPVPGERMGALHRRHALLSQSGRCQRTDLFPFRGTRSGRRAAVRTPIKLNKRDLAAARPAISVPVRSAPPRYTLPCGGCEPPWALASWLCARPARTARSGGRGTLGRDLPGPTATLAARRRRRSFPTKHRREPRSRWEELPG